MSALYKSIHDALHPEYFKLIRFTTGNDVQIGWFGGVGSWLLEGMAVKAVIKKGKPKLKWSTKRGNLRIPKESIEYEELGYFAWRRVNDKGCGYNQIKKNRIIIPCLPTDLIQRGLHQDFKEDVRQILTITAVINSGEPELKLNFAPETENIL